MEQVKLISDQDKTQLKRTFRKDLPNDVKLLLFTQRPSPITIPGRECQYCAQTQQLLEELASLSPRLHLETIDFYQQRQSANDHGISRIPAIVLDANGSSRLKFYGFPLGYELAAIIEGIKTISRGVSPLSMATRKQLRQVNKPVHIQVFVSPTCTISPGQTRLAHAMALECPNITADAIEIQEFPALAQTYSVRSVPLIVINEYSRLAEGVTEAELLEKVLEVGVVTKTAAGDSEG